MEIKRKMVEVDEAKWKLLKIKLLREDKTLSKFLSESIDSYLSKKAN